MKRAIYASHAAIRRRIRVSRELNAWLEILDRRAQQLRGRQHFEAEVTAGNASLDLVRQPLYPYQQEGMLHLAFTGRALLVVADRLDDALQSTLTRQLQEQFPDQTPQLQLLDREAFGTIQHLIEAGVLNASQNTARTLYRVPAADGPKDNGQ